MTQRAGKFTASRAADLMAKTRSGPAASRANLIALLAVERLTGQCVETYQNAAMQRGIDLEGEARDMFAFDSGYVVEECGFIAHPTLPNTGCSPDGLIGDDGLLEIKVPASMQKHLEGLRTFAHAVEYRWQLIHQLMTTGRSYVYAVSYDPRFPDGLKLAIRKVEAIDCRDEIAELEAEIIAADAEVESVVAELKAMRGAA
jgi:hypothetical protein